MPNKRKLMLKKSENEEDEIILGIFLNYLPKNILMKWGVEKPPHLKIFPLVVVPFDSMPGITQGTSLFDLDVPRFCA
jgi:hypothetical protein